ncbi:hypothetical protein AALP_AA8G113400 [Arabis alpina]|uniref:Uncharacterized protein n=1 Tax=Arabis alpina TaxID=50452 RepID=A0A087G6C3_ARAAL|nr:hypothetical protein AALP_AA8G113400 [Arabis alpina]
MGDGRVHFRFQREENLHIVLDNRPYHYDGLMIALERWVPTVRRDFPSTIPFWIIIKGLPDYRQEEETVTSIGKDLGEFHEVDVTEPIPKVRVTLDCTTPLIFKRETDDAGTLCVLDLQYEKLKKYCSRCLRPTHEAPTCPKRPRETSYQRDSRREPSRRREVEPAKDRRRDRADRVHSQAPRLPREVKERPTEAVKTLSRPKPVRRELLAELDSSRETEIAPPTGQSSTKEWVRRTFAPEMAPSRAFQPGEGGDHRDCQLENKRSKPRAPWYRATEEDAAIANAVIFQTEKWAEVESLKPKESPIASSEVEAVARGARVSPGSKTQVGD